MLRDERVRAALARGIYPILSDGDGAGALPRDAMPAAACVLAELGLGILQLRLKTLADRDAYATLVAVSDALVGRGWDGLLVIDDRADLAALGRARHPHVGLGLGVHVGQTDLPPAVVRAIVGPEIVIGCSTHDLAQLASAAADDAVDLVGFGPVFATQSKANPDATVGLTGLADAARLVAASPRPCPLVAIGGLTHANVNAVHKAGASAAAVIGDLVADGPHDIGRRAARLMEAWG